MTLIESSSLIGSMVAALAAGRVNILIVGDSNQYRPEGSHWGGLTKALRTRCGVWGSRLMATGHDYWVNDYDNLGVGPNAWEAIDRIDAGADSTILERSLITKSEFASPGTDLTPRAFFGTWHHLPSGSTSPASGTIGSGIDSIQLNKSSLLFGDLATQTVNWHTSFYIPGTNPGAFRPNVRLQLSLTSISSPLDYTTATGGITDIVIPIPTNSSTTTRGCQPFRINQAAASGNIYLGYNQIVNPTQLVGAAVTPFYNQGGYSLVDCVRDLTYVRNQRSLCIQEVFRQANRAVTPGEESLIWCTQYKGNDLSDNGAAIDVTGAATGPASNTYAGYRMNMETMLTVIYEEWVAAGYNPARLWFWDRAYHPQVGYEGQVDFEDASADVAASLDHPAFQRLFVIRGSQLITPAEMAALGWYNNPVSDRGHLSSAGFVGFSEREVAALYATAATGGSGGGGSSRMGMGIC